MQSREIFEGKVYNNIDFKEQQYENIVESNKQVVIVGCSKAGYDLARYFQRAGHKNYHWIFRKLHNRSFLNTLRGMTTFLALLLTLVSKRLGGLILWSSGLATTFGDKHND